MTDSGTRQITRNRGLAGAATVTTMLLAAILGGRLHLHSTGSHLAEYHTRVRSLIEAVPMEIGAWQGEDVPVPTVAVKLLRPNQIMSRRYVHAKSGQRVSLLIVHCADSRDLLGHYPPACYGGSGWRVAKTVPWTRTIGGLEVEGVHYMFEVRRGAWTAHQSIDGMLFTPEGTFALDMEEVDRASQGAYRRHRGAAQIHFVYDAQTTENERVLAFEEITGALQELMETLLQPPREASSRGDQDE